MEKRQRAARRGGDRRRRGIMTAPAATGFRCTLCNNDMLAAMDGEEATLEGHRLVGHLKCRACGKLHTPRRRREHAMAMHHS